jgi:Rrf2 family nitric oxide-sensitive transcriptional repressor
MSCLAYMPEGLVSTGELAEVTLVPMNYLAKVLQSLAKADLITGRRGVGGGYRLAKPANEITMLDVINAIDPIERIRDCPLKLENHSGRLCPLHSRLDDAACSMIERFEGITLHDMLVEDPTTRPLCDPEMTAKVEITLGGSTPAQQ